MKNECNIVRDLLPLYVENMASDDSAEFVKQHLDFCQSCCTEMESLKMPMEKPFDADARPLKAIKKKLFFKKIKTVFFTAALVLAFVITALAYLTAPQYLEYSPDLLAVSQNADGSILISLDDEVTGYSYYKENIPGAGKTVYHLETWNSILDKFLPQKENQNAVLKPENGRPVTVYYAQNHEEDGAFLEDVLIYGEPIAETIGVTTLPRLSLVYWLIINIVFLAICGTAWFALKKGRNLEIGQKKLC